MILTITLNPCIDKSSTLPILEPETKLRCAEVVHEAGGGGINVSKALKKLSLPSFALFPAGGHNGNMLCSILKKDDILFHAIDTQVETRENWIVLENNTNHQFRFTFPGRKVSEDIIHRIVDKIRSIKPEFIIASGSMPPGLPESSYGMIIDAAAEIGCKCVIDTSGSALEAIKGRKAFLIKPNIGEMSKLLDMDKIAPHEVADCAHKLIEEEYSSFVVVSMGADGAWLVGKEERHFVKAPSVPKKSTVGAGDSMVAGITYALHNGCSIKEAIQWGVACGSAATMNEGTQLFDASTVELLLKQIQHS